MLSRTTLLLLRLSAVAPFEAEAQGSLRVSPWARVYSAAVQIVALALHVGFDCIKVEVLYISDTIISLELDFFPVDTL